MNRAYRQMNPKEAAALVLTDYNFASVARQLAAINGC